MSSIWMLAELRSAEDGDLALVVAKIGQELTTT